MFRTVLSVAAAAMFCGFLAAPAKAAPILGSRVDDSVFLSALAPNSDGWTYLGQNLGPPSPFGIDGTLEVRLRSSPFTNSFGTADMAHGTRTEIFAGSADRGTVIDLSASAFERQFYFESDATGDGSDLNTAYTDGFTSGASQVNVDIFYNANAHTWAFFFDDAGGGLPMVGDNDFNDLIVTFRRNLPPGEVPEPGTMALLAVALFGMAHIKRRRKSTARI